VRTRGRVCPIAFALVLILCTGRGTLWAAQPAAPPEAPTKESVGRVEAQSRPMTSVPVVRTDDVFPSSFAVLYDQTANVNANATSQNFEAAYNAYDQAGKLYRSSYWPLYVAQEQQAVRCDSQVFYDHTKGNYAISGWITEGMTGWHKRDPIAANKFSPDAMAGAGVR